MTCIVGLAERGTVWIGGDSASSDGYQERRLAPDNKKVFLREGLLIGCTTSFRFSQLLEFKLSPPARRSSSSDREYIVCVVAESVRECLREGGYSKVVDDVEKGGVALIGYRGSLYRLQSDFSILQYSDKFDAIGNGGHYALGAMAALEAAEPEVRILASLAVASHFAEGIREPYHVLSIPWEGKE